MFEITITEIKKRDGAGPDEKPECIERLRLTTDVVDVMAVARVAIGGKRKRKGKNNSGVDR